LKKSPVQTVHCAVKIQFMTLSANVTSRTCCAEVIECYVALWAKLNKKVSNKTQQTRHSIQKCRRPSFGRIKQSHKVDYYYFSKI